jgi:hypothetical protein
VKSEILRAFVCCSSGGGLSCAQCAVEHADPQVAVEGKCADTALKELTRLERIIEGREGR